VGKKAAGRQAQQVIHVHPSDSVSSCILWHRSVFSNGEARCSSHQFWREYNAGCRNSLTTISLRTRTKREEKLAQSIQLLSATVRKDLRHVPSWNIQLPFEELIVLPFFKLFSTRIATAAPANNHQDSPNNGPNPTNKGNEKLTASNENIRQVVRHKASNDGADTKKETVDNAQANLQPATFQLGES